MSGALLSIALGGGVLCLCLWAEERFHPRNRSREAARRQREREERRLG